MTIHSSPRSTRTVSLLVLSMALVFLVDAVGAQPIATDRPDFTTGTSIVPRRTLQAELGARRTRLDGTDSDQILETLLRLAVADPVEFQLAWAGFGRINPESGGSVTGAGDLTVGVKVRLGHGSGIVPATTLVGTYRLPSGEDPFRTDAEIPELRLAMAWSLGYRYSLSANVGSFWVRDPAIDSRARSDLYSVSLSRSAIGDYVLFAEIYGVLGPDSDMHLVNGGLLYALSEQIQIDVYGGTGLSGDAIPDVFVGAGAAFRIPR